MMDFAETTVKDHSAEETEPQPQARTLPPAVRSHPGLSSSEQRTHMQQKQTPTRDPTRFFCPALA